MRLLGNQDKRNWGIYSLRIRLLSWLGDWKKLPNFIDQFLLNMAINRILLIE